MSGTIISHSSPSLNLSVDHTCAFNPKTGEIETRSIVFKAVLGWAVTPTGIVPLLAETRDSSILQARLLLAAPRTFVVYLENSDGTLVELGIQSPGASHPDWSKVAQDLLTSEFEASDSASSSSLAGNA